MKRNKENTKQARTRKRSTYAAKRATGNQMYSSPGFSCCGHRHKSQAQANARRKS